MSSLESVVSPEATIAPGTPEELAGPAPARTGPVLRADRISSMDVLRGFSLMGILLMNISEFAFGGHNYAFPLSTTKPVFDGPHWKANTAVWFLRWIFAEGKMRALFSMLFGAGVILLTERGLARGAGVRVADIFTRRNLWLVVFGMLHGYLIWNGDILFFYAVAALIFLFPFRVVRAKRLMWVAGVVLVLNTLLNLGHEYGQPTGQRRAAERVNAKLARHEAITDDEAASLKAWTKVQEGWRMPAKKRDEEIATMQKGYWAAQGHDAGGVLMGELKGSYFGFGDWVGLMLLGMALCKNGFLTGRLSTRTYVWTAAVGLGLGCGLSGLGAWEAWRGHFDMFRTVLWTEAPYNVARVSGALGNAAVLLLLLRAGALKWLLGRVAAVGQMALTNYLLTSVVMKTVYVWGPWHWFNAVEYYKTYYAVLAMWAVNLVLSTVWLRAFEFGPMEWVWRSLTYWKRQPMVRERAPVRAIPASVEATP